MNQQGGYEVKVVDGQGYNPNMNQGNMQQGYNQNPGYNQNQMNNPNQYGAQGVVVQNQMNPGDNISLALRSSPIYLMCPHCSTTGMTMVERSCSCANLCCCIFCGGIIWLLFQACRGKDINCYDAKHMCIKCNRQIGNYEAC